MLSKVTTRDKTGKTSSEFVFDQEKAELANSAMLSIAIVDEKGNRLFTSADIDSLSDKSITPIARIVKVVMDISGLSKESAEDALPNSEPSPDASTFIN